MPIYEYECNCCSSRFDKKQSFYDSTEISCPNCGGKTKRIFSPVPIIFKGSGFYVTDSRNSNSHVLNTGSADTSEASTTTLPKTTDSGEAKAEGDNGAKADSAEKDG